jgi:N-acetylmuramoyl-L-alanine amidase
MKNILQFLIIFFILCAAVPPLAGADYESAYLQAREAYYTLQNSARKQLYRDQWEKVLDKFEQIYTRYPDSSRADDALFMSGKTMAQLYQVSRVKVDAVRSVEIYRSVARQYPDSSLADDALLHAGTLMEEVLDNKQAAYLVYRQLVEEHPDGDMTAQAARRLERLAAYAPAPAEKPVTSLTATKPVPSTADSQPAAAGLARLAAVRFWSNPGYTRVVLDLTSAREFSSHFLSADPEEGAPPRLYLDISSAELGPGMTDPTVVDDGLLRRIRTVHPLEGTVRVVLDLESISDYKVFPLGDPYRIVVDIVGAQSAPSGAVPPREEKTAVELKTLPADGRKDEIARVLDQAPRDKAPLHVPHAPASMGLRRIVVDAGHGGRDPGAIGPGGTYEKHITLMLAKKLARKLKESLGCEVILTRDRDVYLPLEERTAIANKVGADLFISLHTNANQSNKPYGIETYYLNFSKNDKAAALAARENGTSLKEVSDLELILFDLMANSKINESSRLAAEIQKGLVSGLSRSYRDIKDLGVRQGPFYVLLGATMPSVLIETAFISNHREEKRLTSDKYQDHAADAIARAVRQYAENNKMIASR